MKKTDQPQCVECLAYQNALYIISRSVAKLWQSVIDGMHDARSLVGDEALSMKEALEEVGIPLPLDAPTDKKTAG
jgi:hypothetical protein